MRLPTSGSVAPSQEGERRSLNSELWHACAGPLVSMPVVGSHVVYFPQGHSEQVSASTNTEVDGLIPSYPNLPPQLFCQLHNVTLHADIETDEVYAQMTLQPVSGEKEPFLVNDLGTQSRQPNNFFCKTLTASDTSTHGGFSIPRRAAEKVFPPLDFSQQPPAQELIARDLHDSEWKFRHIYRGQPKRHLLTTGWSVFVSAKRLIARDSVLFIRNEKGQLLLGIRHANRPQTFIPSSVLSSDSMHIGILAAAAHALSTSSRFTVFYNPRASPSEFVIPLSKYEKAVYHVRVSVGMRFRMLFEAEESSMRRYMGTITGIGDLDPLCWPNSHWRTIKVGWDESTAGDRQKRVSLWEIEPLATFLMYPPSSNWRLKRPWPQTLGSTSTYGEAAMENMKRSFMWMRGQNGERGFQSLTSQGMGVSSWAPLQQKYDSCMLPGQTDVYDTMAAAALQEIQGNDPSKQLLQFHHQQPQSQQACRSQVDFQQHQEVLQQQQQPQISHPQTFMQPQYPPQQQTQHILHQRQPQLQFQQPFIQQKPIHACNPDQLQQHLPEQHHQALQLTSAPSAVTQFPTSQSLVSPTLLPLPHSSSTVTDSNMAMGASAVCQNTLALQTLLSNMVSDDNAMQSNLLPPSHDSLRQQAGIISASGLHQGSNISPSWLSSVDNVNQLNSALQSQLSDIIRPAGGTSTISMTDATLMPSISAPSLPAYSFLRNCWQDQGPVHSDPHNEHLFGVSIETPFAIGNSISNIPRNFSTGIELQSQLLQAQSSVGGTDFPLHSGSVIHESLDDLRFLQQVQSMVQVNPPMRTFTKVYKLGSIGRSLDVTRFRNYTELRHELARMFGLEGQLEDPHRSGWQLVFIDKENDVLLVGDGPWEEFVSNVRCIKILSLAEVLQMAQEGLELPPIPEARQTSSSSGDFPARQDSRNPSSAITSTCSLEY